MHAMTGNRGKFPAENISFFEVHTNLEARSSGALDISKPSKAFQFSISHLNSFKDDNKNKNNTHWTMKKFLNS